MSPTPAEAIEALRVGLLLVALWLLYFVAWKDYQIDAFRQRLFNLRGELFDFALASGLSFQHPAYGILRVRINRMIRYGHQFNALHWVLILIFMRDAPMPRPHQEWDALVDTIPDEAIRKKLRELEDDMALLMVKRLAFSPFVFPIFAVAAVCVVVKGAARVTMRGLSAAMPGLERLEAQAVLDEAFAQ